MQLGFVRSAIILGVLSCVGPFAIDMYLPVLPQVAEGLGGSVTAAQWTITAYFIAFGVVQLVYGPLADAWGRRAALLLGLSIFMAGSLACALAPTMGLLIAGRVLQALGAAAVMVVPRAVVRDLHTGPQATRLMALMMLVISVSPMLAPLAGSAVAALGGWRSIFLVLAGASVVSILMTLFALPETLSPQNRMPFAAASMARGCLSLLRDRSFMLLTLLGGFGFASFFVFLASAPFVYTGHYGLSPVQFSLAFAVNAIGFFAASQFAGPLGERIGMRRMVQVASTGFALTTFALLALFLAGFSSLPVLMTCLVVANAWLGLIIPASMVMALDDHGDLAGLASSLGGTLQMLAGGAVVIASSPFFDGSPVPMVSAIAVCGLLCWSLAIVSVRTVVTAPAE